MVSMVVLAGCEGQILSWPQPPGGPNPDGGFTPPPVTFACQPTASQLPVAVDALSASEYRNSLGDLLTFALKDAAAAATLMRTLPLAELPDDPSRPRGTFQRMKTDVTQGHLTAWYDIATAVAQQLTTRARLGTVMGSCATDASTSNDAACLTNFVSAFGARAFRRPLTPAEVAAHAGYDSGGTGVDPAGVADVIAGILLAPRFIYHVENGLDPVPGKDTVYTVDAYEVASRLSYQFWETAPDAPLLAQAQSGALLTPAGFTSELDRVYADPRAKAVLDRFYLEWLNLDQTPDFENDLLFSTFVGPTYSSVITPTLKQSAINEAVELFDYHVQNGGGLDDLVTSDLAFPRTPDLAAIYGLPPWDGVSKPPRFSPGTRPGILTRAAFLFSGGAASRPIIRGVLVRRNLLCDAIPDPPADAAAMGGMQAQALAGTDTTRHITEDITQQSGTTCAGCHATLINPVGFALENFDAIGRMRTQEALFLPTGSNDPVTGQPTYHQVGQLPVDTHTTPAVSSGDPRPSTGVADLTRTIVESGKTAACLARNYFRFTYRRAENDSTDGCALEQIRQVAAQNGSLKSALRAIALAPEFQQRSFK